MKTVLFTQTHTKDFSCHWPMAHLHTLMNHLKQNTPTFCVCLCFFKDRNLARNTRSAPSQNKAVFKESLLCSNMGFIDDHNEFNPVNIRFHSDTHSHTHSGPFSILPFPELIYIKLFNPFTAWGLQLSWAGRRTVTLAFFFLFKKNSSKDYKHTVNLPSHLLLRRIKSS